jgi:hypothetical protein
MSSASLDVYLVSQVERSDIDMEQAAKSERILHTLHDQGKAAARKRPELMGRRLRWPDPAGPDGRRAGPGDIKYKV